VETGASSSQKARWGPVSHIEAVQKLITLDSVGTTEQDERQHHG
jgi:hypothetical protein